jgi:hypothetical protein
MTQTSPRQPLDLNKINFFELLAHTANDMKTSLVVQLVDLAGKGDPAALRILETAFKMAAPQDEKNKPIPILGGITQIKDEKQIDAVFANNGVKENTQAS